MKIEQEIPLTPCPEIILAERLQGRSLKEIAWRYGWRYDHTVICSNRNDIRGKLATAMPSDDEIVALVEKHNSLVGVVREYPFVTLSHIRRILKAHGKSFRNGRTPPWQITEPELFEIAERIAAGSTTKQIAGEYGVCNRTVRKHLAQAGLPYVRASAQRWFREQQTYKQAA